MGKRQGIKATAISHTASYEWICQTSLACVSVCLSRCDRHGGWEEAQLLSIFGNRGALTVSTLGLELEAVRGEEGSGGGLLISLNSHIQELLTDIQPTP